MRLLRTWLLSALVVALMSYFFTWIDVDSFVTALLVAAVLGLINITIRPILTFLTLPINLLTFGLFTFVINGLMVLLVDYLVAGFSVSGFWVALLFSVILSVFVSAFDGRSAK